MVNKRVDADDPEVMIETAIDQSEGFLYRNGKKLLIALGCVTVVVAIVFAYNNFVVAPKEADASTAGYLAQIAFTNGDFETALNGGDNSEGFLDVIDQYGSTPTGNVANHYAGICYMQLGDYQNALTYLSSYKAVGGAAAAEIIDAQNIGLQGDANVQLGNNEAAVALYTKAASTSKNALTAPYYLKKAAAVYNVLGQKAKALELYKQIKQDYPMSMEARDMDKEIANIEQAM